MDVLDQHAGAHVMQLSVALPFAGSLQSILSGPSFQIFAFRICLHPSNFRPRGLHKDWIAPWPLAAVLVIMRCVCVANTCISFTLAFQCTLDELATQCRSKQGGT